ncbi:helix-turn-helix domain-containing protein [Chryseobacterium sp. G0240]|uniref:helix-turn-helix domain-containing protein n=1 Tax=Chryseobacterium sp. G0240 TaxID=2487066 RepID=UPI000F459A8C|nr:helix-turn-helix domain-containing protein [Chryseobacterium sp. G0240]ROI02297.1 helix-turn-helix domain-containing protein [Chryseobacterium sp. G0240]
MKKKLILFFFLIASISAPAQTFDFEEQYKYARILSSKNPDSSEIVLNKIIDSAQKRNLPEFLVKAYYLKSYNSYLRSDAEKSLDFADKALKISTQNNYSIGKALAYRMQGTQYAKLGLLKESSTSLHNALSEVKNNNTEEGHELKGMIYNSFLILLNKNQYKEKEFYSKSAIQEFRKLKNVSRRNELLISAYTNAGYNLSEVEKFKEAKYFFEKALSLVGENNHYLRSNILNDIGFSFSKQHKPDSAVVYYRKALTIVNQYGFNEKKIEVTKNLEEAYAELHDQPNTEKYKLENLKLKDSIAYNKAMAVNKTLSKKEESFDQQLNASHKTSKGLIIACLVLIMISGIAVFNTIRLRKKHKKAVAKIYRQGISPVTYEDDPQEISEDIKTKNTSTPAEIKISPEVEEHILNGLKIFEESLEFNNKNISRYNLSNTLNINTKYLSTVIKKHKKFNFNQYINHLRISYIVNQLKNDPQYRKYKINHLAEITGYSSHSAFSLEFKKITGLHPSVFIKNLDEIS